MLKGGLKPNGGKTVFLEQFAVPRDRPCTAPEAEDPGVIFIQHSLEVMSLDLSITVDPLCVDDLGDPAAFGLFGKKIEVYPLTPQQMGQMTGHARFADAHKSCQCDPLL